MLIVPPASTQVRKPRTCAEILGKAWGWWKGPFQADQRGTEPHAGRRRHTTVHLRIEIRLRAEYQTVNFSAVVDQWGR